MFVMVSLMENGHNNNSRARTIEEKFRDLEQKFAALEKSYNVLYEKSSTLERNNSTSSSNELDVTTPSDGTLDKDSRKLSTQETLDAAPRVNVVFNKVDPKTGQRQDLPQTQSISVTPKLPHAFTLRKYIFEVEEDNYGEIDVADPSLWDLLKITLKHYPYHVFDGSPTTIKSPYEPLILNWTRLQQIAREECEDEYSKSARSDLRLLLDTISSGSGDQKLDKYLKVRESNVEKRSVTFETLWTLFPPGQLVYGRAFQGQHQLFIVKDNHNPWPITHKQDPTNSKWSMTCWTYDWNGKSFKRLPLIIEIDYFDGAKIITSLQYFPFEFHPERKAVEEQLMERGQLYKRFCMAKQGSRMFEYRGQALLGKKGFAGAHGGDEDDRASSRSSLDLDDGYPFFRGLRLSRARQNDTSTKSSNVESKVMVDFESYFQYGPASARVGALMPASNSTECQCLKCRSNSELKARYRTRFDEESRSKERWEEEQYMLCPPRVLGYILRDKRWAQLDVNCLEEVAGEDSGDSWTSRLILPDGVNTKRLVLNLVQGHGTHQEDGLEVDDIVVNKGKGLVILLYGPPGVGKTTTAETVAIEARKPLFSISVADVGTEAKKVETNLANIFALATSWQAILLIDEADVFLESRGRGTASNTERNALVSVFLRVLEYYHGILMLTTNQIAQFDVAVQSRIHIAIRYNNLNEDQTRDIFLGFLKPLEKRGLIKDMEGIEEWLNEDVLKMGLDGRQIRSIVTSALGVARAQKKTKLEKKDLKEILNNVKHFKDDYVKQYEKYKNSQDGMIGST